MTDATLLAEYLEHRTDGAFEQLVSRHGAMVLRTARRLGGEDADDIAQAVFLLLMQRAGSLTGRGDLAGWLHETTRYCAANARRSRARRIAMIRSASETAMQHASTDSEDHDGLLNELDRGLAALSNSYRQVLVLRYLEQCSVDETASRLNLTSAAVLKRSTRGLARLRRFFARQGLAASVEGIASCMVTQAVEMTAAQRSTLMAVKQGSTGGGATALASATRRSIALSRIKVIALAASGVIGIPIVAVKLDQLASENHVSTAAVQVAQPQLPTAAPKSDGGPVEVSKAFFLALQKRDLEGVSQYLPGDQTQRKALAEQYAHVIIDGPYARYPQRLMTTNWMVMNGADGLPKSGTFDAAPPIDAAIGRVEITVERVGGRLCVTSAHYADSETFSAGPDTDNHNADSANNHTNYEAAARSWAAFQSDQPPMNPEALKDADLPAVIQVLDRQHADIDQLRTALESTELRLANADVRRLEDATDQLRDAAKEKGVAGLQEAIARCKSDADLIKASQRILTAGAAIGARMDAQQDAHRTAPRRVSIAPDVRIKSIVSENEVIFPGPLQFPEWLRDTAGFKEWNQRHDVRTFVTRDDSRNKYTVSLLGVVKEKDGTLAPLAGQIRMYRADQTLAEVTDFNNTQPMSWKVLDSTGKHVVWSVETRTLGPDEKNSLHRVTKYDADGNEHIYSFDMTGGLRESDADPIGQDR